METINTLSPEELNAVIRNLPPDENGPFIAPKKWMRVDVGTLETYVGDKLYVITLVEKLPNSLEEVESNAEFAEQTVIRYLQGEGFIGEEYAYVGLQRFDLKNLPEELQE